MPTILVAQSAGEPRESLAQGLRTRGFEVGVFDDVDGALEAASGTPISALLVDPELLLREEMALSPRLDVRAGRPVRLLVLIDRANPDIGKRFREHGADLLVRPPQDVERLAKTLHASVVEAPWEGAAPAGPASTTVGSTSTQYVQTSGTRRRRNRPSPRPQPPPVAAPVRPPSPELPPWVPPAPPVAPPPPPAAPGWPVSPPPAFGAWPTPQSAFPPVPPAEPVLLTEPLEEVYQSPPPLPGAPRMPERTRVSPDPPVRAPSPGLDPDELFADAPEEPTHEIGSGREPSRADLLAPPHSPPPQREVVEPESLAEALEPEEPASLADQLEPDPGPELEPPPEEEPEGEEAPRERVSIRDLTGGQVPAILVVDDDPAFRGFLRDALAEQGFRVHTAINAPNALRFIKSGIQVDMVISDLTMPHMDGFELKHEIDKWARDAKRPMPFIIVTGGATETQVQTAAQVKVAAVVSKPIEDLDAFFSIVIDTLRDAGVISQNS